MGPFAAQLKSGQPTPKRGRLHARRGQSMGAVQCKDPDDIWRRGGHQRIGLAIVPTCQGFDIADPQRQATHERNTREAFRQTEGCRRATFCGNRTGGLLGRAEWACPPWLRRSASWLKRAQPCLPPRGAARSQVQRPQGPGAGDGGQARAAEGVRAIQSRSRDSVEGPLYLVAGAQIKLIPATLPVPPSSSLPGHSKTARWPLLFPGA